MRRQLISFLAVIGISIAGLGALPAVAQTIATGEQPPQSVKDLDNPKGLPACSVQGTASTETLIGTPGDDVICTGGGDDTVNALAGDDIVIVQVGGAVVINGGQGDDFLIAIRATSAILNGGPGISLIAGSPGNDEITTEDGIDIIAGGFGDDIIISGGDDDLISGGSGNDTINGGDGDNYLYGLDGNDVITSGKGDSRLYGGLGNDRLEALGSGRSTILGEGGDDQLVSGPGYLEADGGEGNDTIDASLTTLGASLRGGDGADTIKGGLGKDTIIGYGYYTKGNESDIMYGNQGDDFLRGGNGADVFYGGEGADVIWGEGGNDSLFGEDGNDNLDASTGDDNVSGGNGDDIINGHDGSDSIEGNEGRDIVFGKSGNDTLNGGLGNDFLVGGDGQDSILGGGGVDYCDSSLGEASTDTCIYDNDAPDYTFGFNYKEMIIGTPGKTANLRITASDLAGIRSLEYSCGTDGVTFDFQAGTYLDKGAAATRPIPFEAREKSFDFILQVAQSEYGQGGPRVCSSSATDYLGNTRSKTEGTVTYLVLPQGQPSAPQNLKFISDGPTTGLLTWSLPNLVGSPAFSSYKVESSTDNQTWTPLFNGNTSEPFLNLMNLKPATNYSFRVRAVNSFDIIDSRYALYNWSVVQAKTSDLEKDLTPVKFRVSDIGQTSAQINWELPSGQSISRVTDFGVQISKDYGWNWQSAKTGVSKSLGLMIQGLLPNTSYQVRIVAFTNEGRSEFLTGEIRTAAGLPGASYLFATGLVGENYELRWTTPSSDGGSPVTDFAIERKATGTTYWEPVAVRSVVDNPFNAYAVTGLLPGRTYEFRVTAQNAAGKGLPSNLVTAFMPGLRGPDAPKSLKVTSIKATSAMVSWSAAYSTSKLTSYRAEMSVDGVNWTKMPVKTALSTSSTLSGLSMGAEYKVRVAGVDMSGLGDYVYSTFRTLSTVATAPSALSANEISSSAFTLNWRTPSSNGGSDISDYVVEINGGGFKWAPVEHEATSATSLRISGLNPAVRYSVRVKAVNKVGHSKASTSLNVTTLATLPGTVSGLKVKSSTTSSTVLIWTAPNTGGSRISDYKVEYSLNQGETWLTVTKSTSSSATVTIRGLKAKTNHLFRVSAKNSIGFGTTSQNLSITTP
jgi:Ca2+-binding RTX toxin-like protein